MHRDDTVHLSPALIWMLVLSMNQRVLGSSGTHSPEHLPPGMRGNGIIIIIVITLMMIVVYTLSPSYRDQTAKNSTLKRVRANFALIDPNFIKIPLRTDNSAYTENKEVITLCLMDPKTQKPYDLNTVMYVALHELAHVITPDGASEHGVEFKGNFSKLLRRATEIGVYNPRIPIPASYCGVGTA